jgi:beta-glucanase (GH16 family)
VGLVSTLAVLGAVTAPLQAVARSDSGRHKGHHQSHAHRAKATVLLHKAVRRPGVYSVRIAITWPLVAHHGAVKLKIGAHARRARTRGPGRATVVKATVNVHGRVLTIDETRLHGQPTLRIIVKRIGALRPVVKVTKPKPATSPSTAGSSGSSSTSAAPSVATTPVPNGVAGSWNLIFNDQFSGSSLDSSWSTGWFGSGITAGVGGASEPECYDPSHVVEGNNELDLLFTQETETCDGGSHPYTAGMVTTNGKFSFTYGYVEFRAWLPASSTGGVANWPDLWTAGQNWPTDGEIDIAEGLGGSLCAHYHGPTDGGEGFGAGGGTGCPAGTYTGGWHTFGADWEPGIITYYYDGKSIGCVATNGSLCNGPDITISSAPMYLLMSFGSSNAYPITAPATLRVAYVRVWQH